MIKLGSLLTMLVLTVACQAVTKLDAIEVREGSQVAIRDAGVDAKADVAPVSNDAGPAHRGDAGDAGDATKPASESLCVLAEGAQCNPVRQCGCEQDEHCQLRTREQRASCVAPGDRPAWSACHDARECPSGQTCDRGSCRPYCAKDEDCEDGACFVTAGVDSSHADDARVCWKRCELDQQDACADGTQCRNLATPAGGVGTYCVAPFDPCPTAEDGRCDEASGTGTCAEGSDRKDCECRPTLPGAPCDPLSQCGCAQGFNCQVQAIDTNLTDDNVLTLTAACVKPGSKNLYDECADASECGLGLSCDLTIRMCVNYCYSKAQCEDGACRRLPNKDDPELGQCTPSCSRETNAPCVSGMTCATFAGTTALTFVDEAGDYCWQPTSACPVNGVCDEPGGSGLCVERSDPEDCCGARRGAECNHVTGCGCEGLPNTRCIVFGAVPVCLDGTETEAEPWSTCGLDDQEWLSCPSGYGCHESVCRKYCANQADCGENAICHMFTSNGADVNGLGVCFKYCDFDGDPDQCPDRQICIRRTEPNAYCGVPYEDRCPARYLGNGVCDDTRPGGTRVCAMGLDPDCEASDE